MSKYLSEKLSLAIISDTSMYQGEKINVFEPVLREVSSFSYLFSSIEWLGYKYIDFPPNNTKSTLPNNLNLIPVKSSGGHSIVNKLAVSLYIPFYFYQIMKLIKKSDIIHTRGPSIPAMLTIIISFFFPRKRYWHKYAGNWQLGNLPLSYRFQRWLLKKNNGYVIVSQRNSNDPEHILSWKNPCLDNQEINKNKIIGLSKKFNEKFTFCFIGRLDKYKGFPDLLDAFRKLDRINWIKKLHCVGPLIDKTLIRDLNRRSRIPILYHGILDRLELNKIYQDSHFIILPSKSEGFPKVLIEAASYGCIPIVPPIKSIVSEINDKKENGIVLKDINSKNIINTIQNIIPKQQLSLFSRNAMQTVKNYSYEKYNECIVNEIIKK